MTDIWDEKPPIMVKPSEQATHYLCNPKFLDWLENVKAELLTLGDYKRWWLELRELLREYLVDCNDTDIIFSQIKDFKEKAEKWDKYVGTGTLQDLIELKDKLEAIKKHCEEELEGLKDYDAKEAKFVYRIILAKILAGEPTSGGSEDK